MAGFLFDEFRSSLGGAPTHSVIDWNTDDIRSFFSDHGVDTPLITDQDAFDITSKYPAFDGTAINTPTTAVTSNILVLDATDTVYTALDTSSNTVESLNIFKDSGTDTTSPMISSHDDYTGMPFTGTGGDVTVVWAATGIIRI